MATSAAPGPTPPVVPSQRTAETEAAAAALVVDSLVVGTVAAVNASTDAVGTSVPSAGAAAALAAAAPSSSTTAANESTAHPPPEIQQQQQAPQQPATQQQQPRTTPSAAPAVVAATAQTSPSAVQTYNNIQKSKRKERLEQNRISARESRKRKKSMIEELQRTVITLTAENKELNGRNRSLRSNLADIGRKYPNSASIQAILNGVPTPSPQQQPQTPVSATGTRGAPVMAASNFLQQLTTPAQSNVSMVPIMAAANPMTTAPTMVVPYMYIPNPTAPTPGGLVPITAAAPGVPVPRQPGQPVVVQTAPQAPEAATQPTVVPAQPTIPQHHIVIAPQPAPVMAPAMAPAMAPIVATAPILPAPAAPVAIPAPSVPVVVGPPPAPVAAMAGPTATMQPIMEPVPNPMEAAAAAAAESIQVVTQSQQGPTTAPS